MKKRTKIILAAVLGGIVTLGSVAGIAIAIDCGNGNVSGTIVTGLTEGTGQDEWRKYDVDIAFGDTYRDYLYTNEEGDYISAINLRYDGSNYGRNGVIISYNNYFNIADDFDALFVLSNKKEGSEEKHYITPIETTHWLYGDYIKIKFKTLDPNFDYDNPNYDVIESYHIVEVWIRTVD